MDCNGAFKCKERCSSLTQIGTNKIALPNEWTILISYFRCYGDMKCGVAPVTTSWPWLQDLCVSQWTRAALKHANIFQYTPKIKVWTWKRSRPSFIHHWPFKHSWITHFLSHTTGAFCRESKQIWWAVLVFFAAKAAKYGPLQGFLGGGGGGGVYRGKTSIYVYSDFLNAPLKMWMFFSCVWLLSSQTCWENKGQQITYLIRHPEDVKKSSGRILH